MKKISIPFRMRPVKSKKLYMLLLLVLINSMSVLAHDFIYHGIIYTVLDENARTCETKAGTGLECGNSVEGDITIPSSVSDGYNNYTVIGIGERSFRNCRNLTSITVSESVTSIGEYSFYACSSLNSVSMHDSVTSIGTAAFFWCTSLTSIKIPESVTSIGSNAFYGCSSLTSINIPESVTSIGDYTFCGCSGMISVTIPESVTSIGRGAFSDCNSLTSITIPESVTSIGEWAFSACSSLTSIKIPKSMTSIGSRAFDCCSGLTKAEFASVESLCKIDFMGWDSNPLKYALHLYIDGAEITDVQIPESITSIGNYTFRGGSNLTSINIPESVKYIGKEAFYDCSSLSSINIPKSVVSIGEMAFYGCSSLKKAEYASIETLCKIEFKNFSSNPLSYAHHLYINGVEVTEVEIPESITSIGNYAFKGGSNMISICLPETVISIGEYAFGGCNGLTSLHIPESVTIIRSGAFYGCNSLTSINIPETVTSIESYSFWECRRLTSINIPESITYIGSAAFYGCRSLTSINIPNTVTSIGDLAFCGCSGLTSINIPETVKSIGESAFEDCSGLTSVIYNADIPLTASNDVFKHYDNTIYNNAILKMPNATLGDIKSMVPWNQFKNIAAKDGVILVAGADFEYDGIFYTVLDEKAMTCETKAGTGRESSNTFEGDLVIPTSVSDGFNYYSVVGIGENSFINCKKLTSINVPESVTSIGSYAFCSCINLLSINIPKSVTSIGSYAFSDCSSLNTISIPDEVTSIETSTFNSCFSLTSINIPESVTSIGECAFSSCSRLTSINIPESVTDIGENAFENCSSMTSVTVKAAIPLIVSNDVFNHYNNTIYNNAILKMPNATLADIKSTVPWNQFKNIVAKDGIDFDACNCFEYEGIIYSIIDEKARTCETKAISWNEYGNPIEGNIIIPSEVSDGYNKYTVIGVGKHSFRDNNLLTSITIPETVTSIGEGAFEGCNGLERAEFASMEALFKIEFLNGSSNPLCYASHLYINGVEVTEVDIPESTTSLCNYVFIGGRYLTSINIPESVTSIGDGTFYGCSGLKTITIPIAVTSIGSSAFSYCSSLTSIKIPESVSAIGSYTFSDCSSLTSINIPESVSSFGESAFSGCSSLTSIIIPKSVTSIGSYAFSGCSNLKSISIPDAVTSLKSHTFLGCSSLTSIKIPESVTSIGSNAFYGCSSLTSINIPESVTSIGDYTFGCSGMVSVTIPESVTSIGRGAFSMCSSLTSINIPESVASIEKWAFYGCSNLLSIKIPHTVTSIGYCAFSDCTNLTCINSLAVIPPVIDEQTFSNFDATVYVPKGSLEAYMSAGYWKNFKEILESDIIFVDKIVLKGEVSTIKKNRSTVLTAEVTPEDAYNKSVKWVSSNKNIATIDENGNVTSVNSGNVTITAIACDGSGVTATYGMTIIPPTKGDSNDNDEITITDAVNTANFAMGNDVYDFCFEAADVNGDNSITLADASGTIVEVLNQPLQTDAMKAQRMNRAPRASDLDKLIVDDFICRRGETSVVEVKLDNSVDYVALQADITLSDAMALEKIEVGPRSEAYHSLMQRNVGNNTVRIALFSLDNTEFADNDEAILKLAVKTTDSDGNEIKLYNILASDINGNEYVLTSTGGNSIGSSGIDQMHRESRIRITVSKLGLTVFNAEGKTIEIYSVEGVKLSGCKADSNVEYKELSNGTYIIKVGDNVCKVIIR